MTVAEAIEGISILGDPPEAGHFKTQESRRHLAQQVANVLARLAFGGMLAPYEGGSLLAPGRARDN